MFELGEAVRVHMDLHAAAGPVLGELRAQTGESSQVGVLDGHEVVYVDRLESTHSLRLFTETGRRVPVHCTSSGKVLLTYLPEARRHAVLRAARKVVENGVTHNLQLDPNQNFSGATFSAFAGGGGPRSACRAVAFRRRR